MSSINLSSEYFGFHLSNFLALVKSPIKLSTSVSLKYFLSTLIIVFFVNLFIPISLSPLYFQINLIFSFLAQIFTKSFTEFDVLVAITKSFPFFLL